MSLSIDRELLALMHAVRDESIAPADRARLEAALLADANARQVYAELMFVAARLQWLEAHGDESSEVLASLSSVVAEAALHRRERAMRGRNRWNSGWNWSRWRRDRRVTRGEAVVGSLVALAVVGAFWGLYTRMLAGPSSEAYRASTVASRGNPAAQLMAADEETLFAADSPEPVAGETLPSEMVSLKRGVVELRFGLGAKAIVEGPAKFRVESDNRAFLELGKLRATVPPAAIGFTVATPTGIVTDLGTEFGIQVHAAGRTEVHVFSGKVTAALAVAGQAATTLFSGDAIALTEHDKIESLDLADSDRFASEVARPGRFVVHGTGRGLALSVEDPHWKVRDLGPEGPSGPKATFVTPGVTAYVTNDPPTSQWIAPTGFADGAPIGMYRYETHFRLTDEQAPRAWLFTRFASDNEVRGIQLNGQDVPVPPEHTKPKFTFTQMTDVAIERGFVPGENVLSFDIYNDAGLTAFRAEVYGALKRVAKASTRASAALETPE